MRSHMCAGISHRGCWKGDNAAALPDAFQMVMSSRGHSLSALAKLLLPRDWLRSMLPKVLSHGWEAALPTRKVASQHL